MNFHKAGWFSIVAMACAPLCAADVLILRSGDPLFGRVVQRNAREVVFRERVDPGKYVERRVPAEAYWTVIVTIDEARLEALTPDRPHEYVELAEELSLMARDPEARDLAIQLSLTGGRLTSDALRRRCLLQLIALARSVDEEIKFRKLAYLVDPSMPASILDHRRIPQAETSPEQLRAALQTVQKIRAGRGSAAATDLQSAEILTALEPFARILSTDRLLGLATTRQHAVDELLQLLKLEYAIRQVLQDWPDRSGDDSWAEQIDTAKAFRPHWDNVLPSSSR